MTAPTPKGTTLLLTGPPLALTHGTGAQLLFLFGADDIPSVHLYWNSTVHGVSHDDRRSFLLEDPHFRWPIRGKQLLARLLGALGASWWRDDRVHRGRLAGLVARQGIDPSVALVLPAGETDARRCRSLLRRFQIPFVLWVMDLEHLGEITPASHPALADLARRASVCVGISQPIADVLAAIGDRRDTRVIPFTRTDPHVHAAAPEADEPLRIAMVGSLQYTHGLLPLEAVWNRLHREVGRAELHYFGPESMLERLPSRLRAVVVYKGFFRDRRQLDEEVARCHAAYLPGPTEPITESCYSRYSIPSRLGDYLALGLPVLANVPPDSATGRFLAPVVAAGGARLVSKADGIAAGLRAMVRDGDAWERASAANRAHFHEHLALPRIRELVYTALNEAQG